jgi:hypothetical protein
MTTVIPVSAAHFNSLDLSPVKLILQPLIEAGEWFDPEQSLQFQIDYPLEEGQELPDIPAVRLWFVRLDSIYPWLPYCLDWRTGELARYAAMLVPHDFSPREGIQFNPQALDLFLMGKVFAVHHWLKQHNLERPNTLKQMAGVFGYELDDALFDLLN